MNLKLKLGSMSLRGNTLVWYHWASTSEPFKDWADFKAQVHWRFGGCDSGSQWKHFFNLQQTQLMAAYRGEFVPLSAAILEIPHKAQEAVFLMDL